MSGGDRSPCGIYAGRWRGYFWSPPSRGWPSLLWGGWFERTACSRRFFIAATRRAMRSFSSAWRCSGVCVAGSGRSRYCLRAVPRHATSSSLHPVPDIEDCPMCRDERHFLIAELRLGDIRAQQAVETALEGVAKSQRHAQRRVSRAPLLQLPDVAFGCSGSRGNFLQRQPQFSSAAGDEGCHVRYDFVKHAVHGARRRGGGDGGRAGCVLGGLLLDLTGQFRRLWIVCSASRCDCRCISALITLQHIDATALGRIWQLDETRDLRTV